MIDDNRSATMTIMVNISARYSHHKLVQVKNDGIPMTSGTNKCTSGSPVVKFLVSATCKATQRKALWWWWFVCVLRVCRSCVVSVFVVGVCVVCAYN